ncbi:MAG: TMEM14 family protein [Cyanobacteria bacterium P01_G01_bin.39]
MNIVAISATIAYGLLAGLGGIWGYLKSQSKASLISGCVSGVLLLLFAVMQIQGSNLALLGSRIITLLLVVVFGIRLSKTGKFMPSGIMLVAGIIALSCLFVS